MTCGVIHGLYQKGDRTSSTAGCLRSPARAAMHEGLVFPIVTALLLGYLEVPASISTARWLLNISLPLVNAALAVVALSVSLPGDPLERMAGAILGFPLLWVVVTLLTFRITRLSAMLLVNIALLVILGAVVSYFLTP
ncbi:MAG: hypothetical protein AAF384_16505 [Pseudomonadota bacterium]